MDKYPLHRKLGSSRMGIEPSQHQPPLKPKTPQFRCSEGNNSRLFGHHLNIFQEDLGRFIFASL